MQYPSSQEFSLMVAVSENGVIGFTDGNLPWHLPDDFKWFKQHTMNKVIVMGRKTAIAIGKHLPNRYTVILTRNVAKTAIEIEDTIPGHLNGMVARDWNHIPTFTDISNEVVICGGGEVYEKALAYAPYIPLKRIYRTTVHTCVEYNTTFKPGTVQPVFFGINMDWSKYETVFSERHEADERHAHAFTFEILERK